MRLLFRCLLALCLYVVAAYGQATVDNTYAAKVIPFPLLDFTPGACQPGQVYVRKDQPYGSNVYMCGNANAWFPLFTGPGANSPSGQFLFNFPIQFNGTPSDGTALIFNAAQKAWIPTSVPVWKKYTITYASINASNFTTTANLFTLVPRQKICGISMYVVTPFAAPTLTGMSISIGDSLDKTSTDTYTAGTFSLIAVDQHDYNVLGSINPGNGIVQAHVTATGAMLSELTAGAVDVDICTVQQP